MLFARVTIALLNLTGAQSNFLRTYFAHKNYPVKEYVDIEEVSHPQDRMNISIFIMNGDPKNGSYAETMKKVQAQNPGSQFIMVVHKPHVVEVVNAMLAGFSDVLEDPLDTVLLEQAMSRAQKNLEREHRISKLSSRELEVLRLLIQGLPNKHVASQLGISHRTVEVYRARIMDKLVARSFAELVSIASKSRHLSVSV